MGMEAVTKVTTLNTHTTAIVNTSQKKVAITPQRLQATTVKVQGSLTKKRRLELTLRHLQSLCHNPNSRRSQVLGMDDPLQVSLATQIATM